MLPRDQLLILRKLVGARVIRAQLFVTVGTDPYNDERLSEDLFVETDTVLGAPFERCVYLQTRGDGQTPEVLLKPPGDVLQCIGGCGELFCKVIDLASESNLGCPDLTGKIIERVDVIVFEDAVPTGIAISLEGDITLYSVPNVDACNKVITSLEGEFFPTPVHLVPVSRLM